MLTIKGVRGKLTVGDVEVPILNAHVTEGDQKFKVGRESIACGELVAVSQRGFLTPWTPDSGEPIGLARTDLPARRMVTQDKDGGFRYEGFVDPRLSRISVNFAAKLDFVSPDLTGGKK